MNDTIKKYLMQSTMIAGLATASFTAPAYAQVADEDLAVEVIEEEEVVEESGDQIVVTGSRLKKDTFSSFKPLQIIDFQETREVGLLDTIQILQTSEAAAGIQIDSSFGGFVLDNGPGSETINLRGLGADRTLVLVNGRRLAPLGVEGAPTQPSINSVPSILVENADLLLEGASSIYGSDALAGVVNVSLARDFEGFQVEGSTELAEQGGEDFTVAARWGKNFDNGFFGIAGEYDRRDRVTILVLLAEQQAALLSYQVCLSEASLRTVRMLVPTKRSWVFLDLPIHLSSFPLTPMVTELLIIRSANSRLTAMIIRRT